MYAFLDVTQYEISQFDKISHLNPHLYALLDVAPNEISQFVKISCLQFAWNIRSEH